MTLDDLWREVVEGASELGQGAADAYRRATGSQAASEASRRGSPPGPGRNGAVLPPQPGAGVRLEAPASYAHERYLPAFSREQPSLNQERPRNVRQFSEIAQTTPGVLEIGEYHGLIDAPAVSRQIGATQQRYRFPANTINDPAVQARLRGIAAGTGVPPVGPAPADAPGRERSRGSLNWKSAAPPVSVSDTTVSLPRRNPREAQNWFNGTPGVRNPGDMVDFIRGMQNNTLPTGVLSRVMGPGRMIETQGGLTPRPGPSQNRASYTPRFVRVNTPEEARALPPGTHYTTPDGTEYQR